MVKPRMYMYSILYSLIKETVQDSEIRPEVRRCVVYHPPVGIPRLSLLGTEKGRMTATGAIAHITLAVQKKYSMYLCSLDTLRMSCVMSGIAEM